ncbi:hypothetical protein BLSTO_05557 [Blastocystis sp. subtype 1]
MGRSRPSPSFREVEITEEVKEERKAAMKSISNSMGDAAQNRNRRLFGNLLGHLNQARTILSKDQTLFDRQRKLEQEAIEREKQESQLIRETQIQVTREQREREYNQLNELQLEERVCRLQMSLKNRVSYFRTLGRFLKTASEPAVFWQPAEGNEECERRLKESEATAEAKVAEETKRVEEEIARLREGQKERAAMREAKKEEKEKPAVEEKKEVKRKRHGGGEA